MRELDTEHQRGVALARAGRHDEALAVLLALAAKYPAHYPVERDIVVITAWKGDCRATVRRHWPIRDYPDPEPYYVIPVSSCMIEVGRLNEAIALLEDAQKRWPSDASLASAHAAAVSRRNARFLNAMGLEVSTDDSDQGNREWLWSARLTRKLADRTHVYARYSLSRSGSADLQEGEQDRVGVGIEYEFPFNLVLAQEFSGDVRRSGQGGSRTSVVFLPNDRWRFGATYTHFAEDIPLRAKAQLIEANHANIFTSFHTDDYRWSWDASASRYGFTDTNRRRNLFTAVGYAYELQPRREQRVYLEYYQSRNTLDTAVYFNPSRDKSLTVVHKTDFVFATRFRRHVDHLYLGVGRYEQQGFGSHGTWSIRYEQDYDFTD
ncbi:MAG: hypothetical protein OEM83_05380, partial [Gammaproteobacteria bacterium]|nr:hypothetical protein [Gammaproteobacteria bacterium]